MAQDLGARLIRAGLLSRGQLARALAGGPVRGGALVAALIDDGLPEDALVGFFVSDGQAAHASEAELDAPETALVRLVPRAMAEALCALPLRRSGDAVLVALADPTDKHAQAELGRTLGASVVPTAARLSLLRRAIQRAFARVEAENASIDVDVDMEELFDEPPVELVRRKAPVSALPSEYSRVDARGSDTRAPVATDDDSHMPLVRTKPVASPSTPAATSAFGPGRERTRTQDMLRVPADSPPTPVPTSAAPQASSVAVPQASPESAAATPPQRSSASVSPGAALPSKRTRAPAPEDDLLSGDRWSTLPATRPRPASEPAPLLTSSAKLSPDARQRLAEAVGTPSLSALADIGPVLASIRSAGSRDEAVRLACEGALPVCRCAVFLALKRDVLQGREVVGGGVSRESVYNLWIPVTSASVFREAITNGTAHFGAYGKSAADGIYKAAIGSVGGDALVQPVLVAGKPVAVLCVDDLRHGARGRQRVEALSVALGEAFERLIVSKKK